MKFLDLMLSILGIIGLALIGLGFWFLISVFFLGMGDVMFLFSLLVFLSGFSYILFIVVTRKLVMEKRKT